MCSSACRKFPAASQGSKTALFVLIRLIKFFWELILIKHWQKLKLTKCCYPSFSRCQGMEKDRVKNAVYWQDTASLVKLWEIFNCCEQNCGSSCSCGAVPSPEQPAWVFIPFSPEGEWQRGMFCNKNQTEMFLRTLAHWDVRLYRLMFPWIAPRSCREADDYISDSQELFQAVLLQQLSRHWLHVWVCWQRAACHQGYMGTTNGVMVLLLAILKHFFISLSSVASSLHWGSLIWWPKTIEAQAEWRFPHLENWLISVL